MDTILLILAIILLLTGIAGCFLPVLPGPPISFAALLLVNFTVYADFSTRFIIIMAMLAAAVTILDFIFPVWTTKRFGGSKYGTWGAAIGLVLGIFFFPPVGMIFGPLIGAIIGELINGSSNRNAVIAGLGSFAGFLLGIGLKLAVSLAITVYFIMEVI